jgi:hypothetical protein
MEILRADGTWSEKKHEKWETVEKPPTPQQAYKQADRSPDEAAELYNLSSKLGVSQKAVKDNLDVARRAANMPDFDKLRDRAPVLVGQTRDAWFMSLAQDDLENLATIEEKTSALKKQQQEAVNAEAVKNIEGLSSSLVPGFVKGTDTYREFISGQAMDRGGVLWEQRRRLILQGKDLPPDQLEYLAKLDAASNYETTDTGLSSFIPAASELVGQMFESMKSPKVMERGLEGALAGGAVGAAASIPTGGLASPVTATSGAVTGAGVGLRVGYFEHAHDVEAGQAFREFRTLQDGEGNQIDDKTAAVAAELVGVANATLETVGFSALAKVIPGLRKVMSNGVKGLVLSNPTIRKAFFDFAKNYAMAWTGEVTTEMAQELTNIIVGGVLQDQSITQTIKDPATMEQLQGIAEKVGKGMAVTGLVGGGVTLAGDIKAAHKAKTEAEVRKNKLIDVATSVEASRLKERSPEAFAEFMERVGKKNGVEKVYLQADRLVETLIDEQGMTQQEVTTWAEQYGVSRTELITALQTGGAVEMDFGKVAAGVGTDQAMTLFQNDLSISAEETTVNAAEADVQAESAANVRIKELYDEEQRRLISPDMVDQIEADLKAQLEDAGVKGDNASYSIMPIIARANVLAKLTGIEAAEHLKRFGITIQRQNFDEFAELHQLGQVQFQQSKKEYVYRFKGETLNEDEWSQWADDQDAISHFGDTAWRVPISRLMPVAEFQELARDAYLADEEKGRLPASVEELSVDDFVAALDPADIVDSADMWDWNRGQFDEWIYENVIEPNEIVGIKTSNGAMLFDNSVAEKVGEDHLYQGGGQGTFFRTDTAPRGAILTGDGKTLITLFESANLSTFLHELGHFFLSDLQHVAETYGVQVEEWKAIKEWLGVDGELTTEQHEQFARGFEAYLREGEAPATGLIGAFRQFKRWLVNIYKTADALQVEINDDIRRVFDRLVATDEEIRQAREMAAQIAALDEAFFKEAGATPEEIAEYRKAVDGAETEAAEKKDKQRTAKLDERLKEWRKQAKAEVEEVPVYKAMTMLVERGGIDRSSVKRLFGDVKLPNVKGLFKKDGLDIEHAAIEAGYESAREFVKELSKSKTKTQWIEQRVAQLDIEHDAELTTEEAIRTAKARKQMELESKWLARKEAQGRAALTRKALRVWADQTTGGQKVGDAIKVNKLLVASRRLRQQVIKAVKAQDWTKAFDLNEKARLNESLIAAHYRANEAYRKTQARWKRAVKADVAYEYRQQINQLLLRNQMVSRRLNVDEGTPQLGEFLSGITGNLDDITALGVPVFSDWLHNDTRATSEMTWGEIQELDDLLKFLVGRGREVKKALLSDEKTAIADLAAEAVQEAAKMKGKKLAKHDSLRRKLQDVEESYFAGIRIPLWLFRQMDGWSNVSKKGKAGINERQLWAPLAKGLDNFYAAMEEVGGKITPHLEQLITSWKDHGKEVKTDVPVPDCFKPDNRHWTFEHIIMVALNMGNADNLQRMSAGFTVNGTPMAVEQFKELTKFLSQKDWRAVQGIWDSINDLYPQVDAVHLKLNHFRLKKVEAKPITVQTKDGGPIEISGGYFPIRYDGSLSMLAAMWDEMSDLSSRQEAVLQTPSAKSGFTKKRTATGSKLPIKLSMSVLSEHLSDTLRYIHLAPIVRDVDRVTRNKTYQSEAIRVLGPELYKMIRPSLKHMIRPDGMVGTRWEKTIQWAMKRSSAFYMGWNIVTAMKNFGGFFQAQARVGLPTMLRGYGQFIKGPKEAFDNIMKLSPYMRSRYMAYDNDFRRQMMKFKPEKKFFGMSREDIMAVGYAGIVAADSVSFLPTWLGSYRDGLDKFDGDVEQAVDYADTKIKEIQPSGNALDLSHLQRSTEGLSAIGRLFTPFFGFAGNFGNLQRATWGAWRAGKMSLHEFLFHNFLTGVAQPLVPIIFLAMLRTGEPPEPEEIAKEVIGSSVQGLPIVRDLVEYAMGRGYGDIVSTPALELVNIVGRTGRSTANLLTDPTADDARKVMFGLAEAVSFASGVPVSQVYRRMKKGYDQIEEGNGTAANIFLPKRKGE